MAAPAKRPSNSGEWCSAINCTNNRSKNPRMSFFRFLKDPERCKKWVKNVRRDDLHSKPTEKLCKNNVLCADHFEVSQFMNPALRNKLIHCAVPTVFDIPNKPSSVTPRRPPPKKRCIPVSSVNFISEESIHTEKSQSAKPVRELTPKKVALRKKLHSARQQLYRLKKISEKLHPAEKPKVSLQEINEIFSEHLKDKTLDFVMTQIRMASKSKYGLRWSCTDKSLALSFYHASPKIYRLLSKLFRLPSVSTLRKSMLSLDLKPGFSPSILQALKVKVKSMTPDEKLCTLVFDEMSIKEVVCYDPKHDVVQGFEDYAHLGRSRYIANHACVFMARGLTANWKQPFGFVFSSGTVKDVLLKQLIFIAITELEQIGLCVKAVICDQGSNNMAVTKSLGVSSATPYFMHNGTHYFVIYDPPHLIKSIRNNLHKSGLKCGTSEVSWKYVEAFYAHDCKLPVRMAPKFTDKHIKLPPFAALRVKLATQVMSHSVAAGISTMVALGALPSEAKETALFIDRFDKLFNSMNSYTLKSSKPFHHALTLKSTNQNFLLDSLSWLKTIHGNSKIKNLPCIEGWQVSISAALHLVQDLHTNHNIKFLLTSRLNQDCIENLFSVIRGKGGHRDNPDIGQFTSALQQVMVDSLMVASTRKSCKDDLDVFVFGLQNIASSSTPELATTQTNVYPAFNLQENVIPSLLNVQQANVLAYIAGYICHRIAPKMCLTCSQTLTTTDSHPEHLFIHEENYSSTTSLLLTPSKWSFVFSLRMHISQCVRRCFTRRL
ncbi:transposable element p transposase [Plakobranchus ocellatus]|uniref:Transposable element p transposase n=1 Tax=Plakobranchus ocellatus TaxID=259542 RepID=A0AAV3YP60_9GAST|nr:transposable element p transposase [Plakobranchus ocellatus]